MAAKERDGLCREIITKAVVAKGRKRFELPHTVRIQDRPEGILGAWVTNHKINSAVAKDKCVEIQGQYDVDIWYSFGQNSKTDVVRDTVHYCEFVPVRMIGGDNLGNEEVRVVVSKYPRCREAVIGDDGCDFHIEVEVGFHVAIIAETTLCVRTCSEDACKLLPSEDSADIPDEFLDDDVEFDDKKDKDEETDEEELEDEEP